MNIFKEIESDLGEKVDPEHSDLSGWVEQGVLLLNMLLTVRLGLPLSHRRQGWEEFTDQVLTCLNKRKKPMVFILWGSSAQKLREKIDTRRHVILESAHPSPLSAYRGFFGSKIFSKANFALRAMGEKPIDWAKT